jgi:asparagine synthase (glutamine-hydrolysing)
MSKPDLLKLAAQYVHRGAGIISAEQNWRLPVRWSSAVSADSWQESRRGDLLAFAWGGLSNVFEAADGVLAFPTESRAFNRDLRSSDIRQLISTDPDRRVQVLPPFGAFLVEFDRAQVAVDEIGFSHLYARQLGRAAAVSTSARALALLESPTLSDPAVAVQSLLGWQLGERTMFSNVRKIPPRASATVEGGRVFIVDDRPPLPKCPRQNPARAAAEVLRAFMSRYLEDHPDAELQLTGGLDSRILLAAIPPSMRRNLKVMTLTVPGSEDSAIAADLAARYGMEHRTANFDAITNLSPADAFRLCCTAARRVDCAADPLALAAVDLAELSLERRPRIAGLGGEVARGFYYFGKVSDAPVTRARVARLARWRMFTNEAAPTNMLNPEFAEWARETAIDDIYREFVVTGLPWFPAMDEFYLGQRMHRWAGVLASANAMERSIVNPMLDREFLGISRSVHPRDKKNAKFLSRILMELDPKLALVRLDARPAPINYAQPTLRSRTALARTTGTKITRKLKQRIHRTHRPPEGGEALAALVSAHLRDQPHLLNAVDQLGMINRPWLDAVLSNTTPVEPSAIALLINLLAAGADPLPR